MVIHNLQTKFRLLLAIVHKGNFKNILICAQIPRLRADIFMPVYVCMYVRFLLSNPLFSAMSMHPIRVVIAMLVNCRLVTVIFTRKVNYSRKNNRVNVSGTNMAKTG